MWAFLKRLVFYMILLILAFGAIFFYNPSKIDTSTNDSPIRVCSSDKARTGMCASKPIKKDEPLGLVATINGDAMTYTPQGKIIRRDDLQSAQNVTLQPLYIDDGRVDFYAYAKNNISEGDEIVTAVL